MRKDILAAGIALSLIILHESYGKFTEVVQKKEELSKKQREVKKLEHQLRVLRNLKSESGKLQPPQLFADELVRKAPFYGCSFRSSFKEKKDGNLRYVEAKLECRTPDFSSGKTLISLLTKDYPASIGRVSYRPGRISASLKIFGE